MTIFMLTYCIVFYLITTILLYNLKLVNSHKPQQQQVKKEEKQQQQQRDDYYCPISIKQCSNSNCNNMSIYCEYDYNVTEIPNFNIIYSNNNLLWQNIIIRHTNIKIIHNYSFIKFFNLTKTTTTTNNVDTMIVDLSFNNIEFIEHNAFMPFKYILKKLILEGNRLKQFKYYSYLSIKLEYLNLNNNQINMFYFNDDNDHDYNYESSITTNNNKKFALKSLYLNNNLLSQIPSLFMLDNNNKNNNSNKSNNYFDSIIYLDLSSNPILELKSNTFSSLNKLDTLLLRNLTKLTYIHVDAFNSLYKLTKLYLSIPFAQIKQPNVCWFNSLIELNELEISSSNSQYEFDDDYCTNNSNICWISSLIRLNNVTVINPKTSIPCKFTDLNVSCPDTVCSKLRVNNVRDNTDPTNVTTTTKSTANDQQLAIILGCVLGSIFVILIVIIVLVIYFSRNEKCCFKSTEVAQDDDTYNSDSKADKTIPNKNEEYLEKSQSIDDDQTSDMDNTLHDNTEFGEESEAIGDVFQIIELSDSNLDMNTSHKIRFDPNIRVYNERDSTNISGSYASTNPNNNSTNEFNYDEDSIEESNSTGPSFVFKKQPSSDIDTKL